MVVISWILYEVECLLLSEQPVVCRRLEAEKLQNSSAEGPKIAKLFGLQGSVNFHIAAMVPRGALLALGACTCTY